MQAPPGRNSDLHLLQLQIFPVSVALDCRSLLGDGDRGRWSVAWVRRSHPAWVNGKTSCPDPNASSAWSSAWSQGLEQKSGGHRDRKRSATGQRKQGDYREGSLDWCPVLPFGESTVAKNCKVKSFPLFGLNLSLFNDQRIILAIRVQGASHP